MLRRASYSLLAVCVILPAARAQVSGSNPPVGYTHKGQPYGPRVAPPWSYYGLEGPPYVTYPYGYPGLTLPFAGYGPRVGVGVGIYPYGYPGYFGYSGRAGSVWSNGLSLYGPPVPVYGPIPGVFGNDDLVRQWRSTLAPGLAGYGWIGLYAASPRPRYKSVSVQPAIEPLRVEAVSPNIGASMIISVTVPQPTAEVFVDGKKTTQTGTDRSFESPPLEAGKTYKYTITARWVMGGQVVEVSKDATGTAGEVVRVDFGR